jgi:acetyl-CoA carboxylase carboxyl transferase subunit alpha
MHTYLEFESQIAELEGKIAELRALGDDDSAITIEQEIEQLEKKAQRSLADLYKNLDPWQKTQVARHPDRPHFEDYARALLGEFVPLAGDRKFGEDKAIIGGPARLDGEPILVIGQEKGSDTHARLEHNFGMARPEGYRKAVRIMDLADRFDIPVITLVDTAGAYPGVGAEERGQAEAIARSIEKCLNLTVPIVSVITGEGGSGGAMAIAAANRVYMLEHSIYSVASPEAAASIVWRDASRAKDVATAMKITAQDLQQLGVIDGIVDEPVGGAHRDPSVVTEGTAAIIRAALEEMAATDGKELRTQRRDKFLAIGRNLT